MRDVKLYKRGFSFPLLRCLDLEEAHYVMHEVHKGVCGNHYGVNLWHEDCYTRVLLANLVPRHQEIFSEVRQMLEVCQLAPIATRTLDTYH